MRRDKPALAAGETETHNMLAVMLLRSLGVDGNPWPGVVPVLGLVTDPRLASGDQQSVRVSSTSGHDNKYPIHQS